MKQMFLMGLFISVILSCNTDKRNENVTTSTQAQETLTTEQLTDSIYIKHIRVGKESPDEKKKFHASYPSTTYSFINVKEEEFVQFYFNEFTNNANQIGENSIGGIDFGQHFELIENSGDYLTFLIERYSSYGNNYDSRFFTHIYDLKNQSRLQFSDLLKGDEAFKTFSELAKGKAESQLKKILSKKELSEEDRRQLWANMQDDLKNGTSPSNKNYMAFSWNKQGRLTIYFDKYQIASGDFGAIQIQVEPSEYQQFIRKKYQHLFHLQIHEDFKDVQAQTANESYKPRESIDCSTQPCVALTFDDGPSIYTPKLLDILKDHNVKATFFVLGKSAKVQKNTILRTAREGHQIGNHSWDHKDLKNLSEAEIEHQIYDTNSSIAKIIGEEPHLMRPPYGSMNATVKQIANMPIILWNLDPLDWKDRDAEIVAERMSEAQSNGIVLAHDIHKTTVDAIPAVIKALQNKGYYLVTIDELFAGQILKNGEKYSKRK